MPEKNKNVKKNLMKILNTVSSHHTGAYAAQAAYFFVLSLIPIIILLLTMVQFTSVTMDDVMEAVLQVFPSSVEGLIRSIVLEVYTRSGTIIPITVLVAVWSAGKGVLSVTSGLNCIYNNTETRNYLYLRVRASFYTIIFILAIMLSLVLSVFGNSISAMLYQHVPFLSKVVDFIIKIRTVVSLVVLTVFWDMIYKFSAEQEEPGQDYHEETAPGSSLYRLRMAVDLLCLLGISGYLHGIFQYVRELNHHHLNHALAVWMYVYHPAGRGGQRADGGIPGGKPGWLMR